MCGEDQTQRLVPLKGKLIVRLRIITVSFVCLFEIRIFGGFGALFVQKVEYGVRGALQHPLLHILYIHVGLKREYPEETYVIIVRTCKFKQKGLLAQAELKLGTFQVSQRENEWQS